ncbi:pectin degradation protein KdgF [Halalkalibacter wakoensis JCM 9140]|uniref:Pectin degradation protein KdgF n=1 Tax=Halalkalibacter wakoensis JCM 9140 TaxID=1236970 RepID=W4Q5R8_9BACI|nr:cupin domain-containing protein [Halalkalibacter wakoensis]GAE27310.1 pectin degradation protein KdgF [Halalkalibacter wakoensis JCM 9140]
MVEREVLTHEGSLMFVKVALKKGFYGDVDQHVHEQVSYINKGSVEFEVNGITSVLKEGDVQYIPSNVEHRVKVLEDCIILDVFTPIREDLIE